MSAAAEPRWYQAGPLLFGGWGAGRLYGLGLAYALAGRAAPWHVAAIGALMLGVGLAFRVVGRLNPEGGGIYAATRRRSPRLALAGAWLLCADYVATAALSCLVACEYLGLSGRSVAGLPVEAVGAAALLLAIGGVNSLGPTRTGAIAFGAAPAAAAAMLTVGLAGLPHLGALRVESPFRDGLPRAWLDFTGAALLLSGVEAVANMTGVVVAPVAAAARRAIVPVLAQVVALNLLLASAISAMPDASPTTGPALPGTLLRALAAFHVGPGFAGFASILFAALLISAAHRALADLVAIQYMLARDGALPRSLARLNRYGMPPLPLLAATAAAAVTVLIVPDLGRLAGLYVVGVVGAIAITLGVTASGMAEGLDRSRRRALLALTALLGAIGATAFAARPEARGFALIVLAAGMGGRLLAIAADPDAGLTPRARSTCRAVAVGGAAIEVLVALLAGPGAPGATAAMLAVASVMAAASFAAGPDRHASSTPLHPEGQESRTAEAASHGTSAGSRKMIQAGSYTPRRRYMVATQGNPRLIDFALQECLAGQAELQILFVRHLAVAPTGPATFPGPAEDVEAQALFDLLRDRARAAGVPLRLVYAVARDIPEVILDMAVTHGADRLVLGASRRGSLWTAMKGDVIRAVAEQLPDRVGLLIHA